MFSGKTLLITGGTGSFGNAVLKRFLRTDIKEVRIFSRDEKKQDDMRKALKDDKLSFYIGDVRDFSSISAAMGGVDYVFQAAALKQVPSCEFFPMEAVRTNVIGTDNELTAAVQHGVKKAICLSTDKAVYPINAMGVSRAMTEAELVLYACKHAKPGDIFVQKAPASTIMDLALAVKEVFKAGNEVKVIGTRHGEKQHETLLTREEMAKSVDLEGYYRIPADTRDLNYDKYFVDGQQEISRGWEYTSANTRRLDVQGVIELLLKLDYVQEELATWKGQA